MSNARRLTATHLPPKLADADASTTEYWLPRLRTAADAVTASLETARDRAIDLGKQLIEAKAKLPHGEFGKLFNGHPEKVAGHLSISYQWANKVMTIAANPAISNVSYTRDLPRDLDPLYELASIPAPSLEAAIEAGRVTPKMDRKEAAALKNEVRSLVTVDDPAPRPRAVRQRDPSEVLVDLMSGWCHRLHEFLQENPSPRVRSTARLMIANMTKAVEVSE